MILPKLIITDIDGVWTDGGMFYDEQGNELKKFNTIDSAGVLFCKLNNIEVAIITSEKTNTVVNRAKKLKINHVFTGVNNKVEVATKLINKMGIGFEEVAYIGDDIGDVGLLKLAGISASPANAPGYIKKIVHFVTNKAGGEGAFREFVEIILEQNNRMNETLRHYGL